MNADWNVLVRHAAVGLCGVVLLAGGAAFAQPSTGADVKALDQPPSGFFTSLVLAHGYKESKDAFQTDRYKPDRPANAFKADVESVYLVFDVLPRENPADIIGQLFLAQGEGRPEDQLLYAVGVYLQTSQDSGFIEFQKPKAGWVPGEYKLKIHIGEKVTAASQLGTLRFKIVPSK
nr:hypothetical protein [Nitrospirota bacterium]